jgi:RNA polymerase sigma-70 factor (ECF subfamily)
LQAAETEFALALAGKGAGGAAAMDIVDETEPSLGNAFHREAARAPEFAPPEIEPEEQADRVLRLIRDERGADEEDAVANQHFGSDPYEQVLALYKEYRPRLFGYLRSLHLGRDEAEEVIQEAFLGLTNKLLKKVKIDNVQGWIVHVAHDLAVDVIRRRDRNAKLFHDAADFEFESVRDRRSSPAETLLEKERRQAIETALERFTPQHRQCFYMRAEGFRYKDIALALGISEQRVALIVKQVVVRLVVLCG